MAAVQTERETFPQYSHALPSPKDAQCCGSPWTIVGSSNRSPIPEVKEEQDTDYNHNSNHSAWYHISNSDLNEMSPIAYTDDNDYNYSTYPAYRPRISGSPDRKHSYPPMNTLISHSTSPGLGGQRKSHYAPAPPTMGGSPSGIYGTSPRVAPSANGSGQLFPSQIAPPLKLELNTITENPPVTSGLPNSFLAPSIPPPMNRTHSGTILKPSERHLFNEGLPQIQFSHHSHRDSPSGGLKGEYEPAPTNIFHNHNQFQSKHEFEHGMPAMYPMGLPGMPVTNSMSHAPSVSYYAAPHIEDLSSHGGVLGDSFGDRNGYGKREYHLMDDHHHGYQQWPSPDTIQLQKPKRRKSSANHPWTLSDDDKYLMKLKDEDQLPWKEIVSRFKEENRGTFRVPALQMRLKRIKERIRQWTPEDEKFLEDAKKWLDKSYWEIVSSKMVEYGRKEKIPGTSCEKKWKELNARRDAERGSNNSGSGRLLHDELHSTSHSPATSPATNYTGYEDDDEEAATAPPALI